tara:strand:+ start:5101 stop:7920 length:2820 start_codon:yes stop_codon:yes gene_type:complete
MSTYDIINGLEQAYRHQIDKKKVCIFWDTNLGASEEALIDAYIAAHGLNSAHKYGLDLSIAENTDRELLWGAWLSDLADYIEKHQIQAICCSPNCPLTQEFINSGNDSLTAFSTLLASSVSIKKILQIENIPLATLLSTKFLDQEIKNLTVKTLDNTEIAFYTQNGGLLRDDLPVNAYDFNIDGILSSDFRNAGLSPPNLWSTEFNAVKGLSGIKPRNPHNEAAILKIPSWRIGWKASGQMPSPTPEEITNMVNRGKAAGAVSFDDHKAQSRISMTLRDRTSEGHCGKGVALGKVLDSIGYTNYNYGFRTTHSNTLATIPAVDDSSLAHFKKLDPISDQTDPRFVATNTPVLDTEPDLVNTNVLRYYTDTQNSPGHKGMRFDAYNNATFPLECFIHFSLFGNFNSNNNLDFYNSANPNSQTMKVKDGGCIVELTSHGHKISPMALRHGASAALCSYVEPLATSAIMKAERFIFSLLRGNSYALAAMRTQDDWTDEHELWGDGLAQPYKTQANDIIEGDRKMKQKLTAIISGKTAVSSPFFLTNGSVGSVSGTSLFPINAGQPNNQNQSKDFFIDHGYDLTNAGTNYSIADNIAQTATTGTGSGTLFRVGTVIAATGTIAGYIQSANSSRPTLNRGSGHAHGDILTMTGSLSGQSDARLTVRNDLLYSIDFDTDDFFGVTPWGSKTISYQGLATDSLEDITDGLLAACRADAGINALFTFVKIEGTNASNNGRFGIRAFYNAAVVNEETQVVTPVNDTTGLLQQEYIDPANDYGDAVYAAGVPYVNLPEVSSRPTSFEYRNDNDEIQFQFGVLNVMNADAAAIGLSFAEASRTIFVIFAKDGADSARLTELAGKQPEVTKMTFKNLQRADLNDIVVNGTDLKPWVNVSSVYNYSYLNGNTGAENRTLDFEVGNIYEVTIEMTAKNLGLTTSKRLVKRGYM